MALHNLLADGQADSVARIFRARMQPLEDDENILRILGSDSDPVIAHAEKPPLARSLSPHRNLWLVFAAELDRVSNQILKELRHLRPLRPHPRQRVVGAH